MYLIGITAVKAAVFVLSAWPEMAAIRCKNFLPTGVRNRTSINFSPRSGKFIVLSISSNSNISDASGRFTPRQRQKVLNAHL